MTNRLHYLQISGNPLLWIEFFRELRNPLDDWHEDSVQPGEELSLDGIAYRIYTDTDLSYVIREALQVDDTTEKLKAGTTFKVPETAWLRARIIYHKAQAEKLS